MVLWERSHKAVWSGRVTHWSRVDQNVKIQQKSYDYTIGLCNKLGLCAKLSEHIYNTHTNVWSARVTIKNHVEHKITYPNNHTVVSPTRVETHDHMPSHEQQKCTFRCKLPFQAFKNLYQCYKQILHLFKTCQNTT